MLRDYSSGSFYSAELVSIKGFWLTSKVSNKVGETFCSRQIYQTEALVEVFPLSFSVLYLFLKVENPKMHANQSLTFPLKTLLLKCLVTLP